MPSVLAFRFPFFFVALFAPLLLCQCKTSTGTYKDIAYDPSKLKTPAGHGLERKDYPFDEQGNYRKDWVQNGARGRDRSAAPAPAAPASPTESAPSKPYPTYAQASADRTGASMAASASAPASAASSEAPASESESPADEEGPILLASSEGEEASATPASPSYHRVSSGDTLFSLASRYNTSVGDLKRINGLSGDRIRAGQSLRLP